jgi:hypothetical protein
MAFVLARLLRAGDKARECGNREGEGSPIGCTESKAIGSFARVLLGGDTPRRLY